MFGSSHELQLWKKIFLRMHRAGAAGRRRARRLSGRSLRSAGWGWHLSRLGCWHLDRCHQLRDHCRESAGSAHQKLRGFWESITANPWRNSFERTNGPTGDAARAWLNQLHAGLAVIAGTVGFFGPRYPPPWLYPSGTVNATSFYYIGNDDRTLPATADIQVDESSAKSTFVHDISFSVAIASPLS